MLKLMPYIVYNLFPKEHINSTPTFRHDMMSTEQSKTFAKFFSPHIRHHNSKTCSPYLSVWSLKSQNFAAPNFVVQRWIMKIMTCLIIICLRMDSKGSLIYGKISIWTVVL